MARGTANEIAVGIERDIASGRLRPGQQLTSVRDLSVELDVSPTTVASAYRKLRDRGLVVGRGRQGTKVAPLPASTMRAAPPVVASGLIDAANGSPDPALLPDLAPFVAAAASDTQTNYSDPQVTDTLAAAARACFEADGIECRHLTITSGSMDAIERVLRAQGFRAGDRIGVEDPGHIPVHQVARSAGLELVALPVDPEGITADGLRRALDRGISAMVVTPRAQNPTGAALSETRAKALSAALRPYPSVVVLHDDHAGPIAGHRYHHVDTPGPRWATIRSLGKSYGPDLRVALVSGDEQTINRVSTAIGNGPGWISHLLQRIAAQLLVDQATADEVATAAASYRQRRLRLVEALHARGVPASGPSGVNVWIPTTDEQAAVDAARSAGFAIRAAAPWRIDSPPAVRVTISRLTNDHIDELSNAFGKLWATHQASPQI